MFRLVKLLCILWILCEFNPSQTNVSISNLHSFLQQLQEQPKEKLQYYSSCAGVVVS